VDRVKPTATKPLGPGFSTLRDRSVPICARTRWFSQLAESAGYRIQLSRADQNASSDLPKRAAPQPEVDDETERTRHAPITRPRSRALQRARSFARSQNGRVWGNGMTVKVLWDGVRAAAAHAGIDKLAPARSAAHMCPSVPPSRVANSTRFRSCSGTCPSRRRCTATRTTDARRSRDIASQGR
jgi:hypothetical protein